MLRNRSTIHMLARRSAANTARGFTLLEMMLVVVIMGVLISVAAVSILGRGEEAKKGATRATMATTASMIKNYVLEQGAYPADLSNLVPKYLEKVPTDAWKHQLIYIANAPGSPHPFSLYSYGQSGQAGGSDSIDYWEDQNSPATSSSP
jgi:general secretion pathway protein G